MKRFLPLVATLLIVSTQLLSVLPLSDISNPAMPDVLAQEPGGMPGWPLPAKTIPHHEPGHPSRAESYTTQVVRPNEVGIQQAVEISGVDALTADGLDPLAGNYTFVNLDKIMMSWNVDSQTSLQTFTSTLSIIPGSERTFDNYRSNDIAAGDLNNDGQTEQIVAWMDPTTFSITMSIGEMPGSLGRTTSAPAAVAHADGSIDLLVRGYDEALWHRHYDGVSVWGAWDDSAGGTLLSAPAVASLADGQFDAFAIGTDNEVYGRHWEGGWNDDWQQVGDWPHAASSWTGPTPELPAPAAVARDGGFDLFRVGPDNTLRWYDGAVWQSLGGMLASGPGAVSLGADHMQVFARGVDEALWYLTYSGGNWGSWQRVELDGMDEGVTLASAPTAVSAGAGQIEVYARGSDSQLWQIAFDGSNWGSWLSLGGSLASGVAVAAGSIFAQADDGSLQHSDGSVWTPWGGLIPCCSVSDTGLSGQLRDVNPYEDYSLDVETGYFLGDGRSQIVVAYLSSANRATVSLYKTAGGFIPYPVGQVEVPHDLSYFKITTGDFLDSDGIDEIAMAYVHNQSYGVDIIRLSSGALEVAIERGAEETESTLCWNGANPMKFAGTLEAVSGDLDGDGQDEIAMAVLFDCEDYEYSTLQECQTYRYHARNRIYDIGESGQLSKYYIEDGWGQEAQRMIGEWRVGLALAAGDVDGDGQDELVRTWPVEFGDRYNWCMTKWFERNDQFSRKLQVYKLPTEGWPDGGGQITVTPFYQSGNTEYTSNSYIDRLATGDLDRDLKAEAVWHIGTESDRILRTYNYVVPESGDPSWAALDAHRSFVFYPNLVTGDFTGESLRVGPPNYRRQYSVGRITAIINAPPKHIDILNGVTYNINADDPATQAKLTLGEGTTTDVSLTTKRDWGLSTTFATATGDPEGTHTTKSLTASYGQNFEKQDGYLTTFDIQQTREASADDALFYIRTDYDVWEYPVLIDKSDAPASYITVVFPVSAPRLRVDRGNTCDSWYQPRHQLGNVWSYPSKAQQLVDRDELGSGDLVTSSDYLVSADPSSFTVNWGAKNVTKLTSGFDLGFSNEFEWQIGGDEVSFEISGIGLKTRLPSFKFSCKADYNYSQLAEWEVATTSDTEVYGYLNGIPGGNTAGYDYAVWPYLYWAEDGYLMLDYTTSTEGTFWAKYDKPDPAFILPWADGQCNTADEPQTEAFTRDILIDPPMVSAGDPVTLTATVRNFSLKSNTKAFNVTFYLGDPDAGGTQIGDPQTIAAYGLGPRDVKTVTVDWTATGSGEQRIYAVIDRTKQLAEVHDESDPIINNNKGYGLVRLGAIDFVDMGEASETVYYPIAYGLSPAMQASLFVPVGNLAQNTRVDLHDSELAVQGIAGKAFELQVFRGELNWDTPEADYYFQPDTDHPPAVMTLSYADGDIAGLDEGNLNLYRLGNDGWEVATCPNYEVQRFPETNLLVVPLCQASTFALSDKTPDSEQPPTIRAHVYLPVVLKSAH